MIARFGKPPQPGQSYIVRPGAYAVLHRANRFLITHQAQPVPEYQLPGGGIDPGESPIQALHREVMEETGWRIRILGRLGSYRRFTFMPDYDLHAEKICHIFVARPTIQQSEPIEPHHTSVWLNPWEAASRLSNNDDAAFLAQHIRRREIRQHTRS